MRKTTLLRLLSLTATGALVAACGASDRTFAADNPPEDAATSDSATGNDAGSGTDGTSTPDRGGGGDTGTTPEGGGMDAQSDQRADAGADARSDVAADTSADTWSPDTTTTPDTYTPDNWTPPDTGLDASLPDVGSDATDWDASDAGGEFDCSTVPVPTISPAGTVNLCPGKSVTLTSSAAVSYSWSTRETTQSISVTSADSYTVTTTESHGCRATSAPTNVVMYPTPTTPTITAGGPTRFCQGGLLTLTANSAASYLWNTGATTQSIQVNASGNYTVTTTDANGCGATSAPVAVEVVVPASIDTTFAYTGNVVNWVVPECVSAIEVDAYGAQGGNSNSSNLMGLGGLGGRVRARLNTQPGTTLQIRVGGAGALCSVSNVGGWNGGGVANCNGSGSNPIFYSATGGGATDIRTTPYSLYERAIVAGGGGGAGYNCNSIQDSGGVGGGVTGGKYPTTCGSQPASSGGGGTQAGGGIGGTYTSFGTSGSGGWGIGGSGVCTGGTITANQGGGGGGGYYGGGGGCWVGGGGGSDYIRTAIATLLTQTPGVQSGNGSLRIIYPPTQ
jgi:hypothetical protein